MINVIVVNNYIYMNLSTGSVARAHFHHFYHKTTCIHTYTRRAVVIKLIWIFPDISQTIRQYANFTLEWREQHNGKQITRICSLKRVCKIEWCLFIAITVDLIFLFDNTSVAAVSKQLSVSLQRVCHALATIINLNMCSTFMRNTHSQHPKVLGR